MSFLSRLGLTALGGSEAARGQPYVERANQSPAVSVSSFPHLHRCLPDFFATHKCFVRDENRDVWEIGGWQIDEDGDLLVDNECQRDHLDQHKCPTTQVCVQEHLVGHVCTTNELSLESKFYIVGCAGTSEGAQYRLTTTQKFLFGADAQHLYYNGALVYTHPFAVHTKLNKIVYLTFI